MSLNLLNALDEFIQAKIKFSNVLHSCTSEHLLDANGKKRELFLENLQTVKESLKEDTSSQVCYASLAQTDKSSTEISNIQFKLTEQIKKTEKAEKAAKKLKKQLKKLSVAKEEDEESKSSKRVKINE
jgi:hypothetical protein